MTLALAVLNVALILQHASLTTLIDFENRTVTEGFYAQHAIYLWLTTAEWALGIPTLGWLLKTVLQVD